MSHHFLIPANENGLILDQTVAGDLALALSPVFGFREVFLYSHGWWTNASQAMQGYNRFTIEFSALFRSLPEHADLASLPTLSAGIHWPSTLSENQFSLANYFQALSFYTMEKRADTIGHNAVYTLLRLILTGRQPGTPLRIHLVGHSFGCKVVCKGLQRLADERATQPIPADVTFDVALVQAAFDFDELESPNDYGDLLTSFPGLRVLVTRSGEDRALWMLYPMAHRLARLIGESKPALGAAGPSSLTVEQAGGVKAVQVGRDFTATAASVAGRLVVADLTSLHQAHPENTDSFSGHHSDIFHPEIYRLLAAFCFGERGA
jgi:hypothetical protein